MNISEIDKNSRTLNKVVAALSSKLGTLKRVGGQRRVYTVGPKVAGACFLIGNTPYGIGLAWGRSGDKSVSSIYFWRKFSQSRQPDYVIDLPAVGDFDQMVDAIVGLLRRPRLGKIEVGPTNESLVVEDALLPREFGLMAQAQFGPKIANLSMADLQKVATDHSIQIPQHILKDPTLKNGSMFDLSPLVGGSRRAAPGSVPAGQGQGFDDLVNLAKAKTVRQLASQQKIVLFGRTPDGVLFEIPGLEDFAASIERMYTAQVGMGENNAQTMAEQYKLVQSRALAIATNKTNFVKSLLVIGAPSSGKTFNIMDTIKKAGLKEGENYVIKKGKISALGMYRTLIEQIDGLTIFDDCDSVVGDPDGVNMLKGALDTDPIRQISYDVQGMMNTSAMKEEDRNEVVNAVSRILRGEPTSADMERFDHLLKKNKGAQQKAPAQKRTFRSVAAERGEDISDQAGAWNIDAEIGGDDAGGPIDQADLAELQNILGRKLPNKIDYRGRIIFISNMKKEDWDSAILTRAFYVNMQFNSGEMLDYIEGIKQHLKADGMSEDDKQEVIDWIRQLYTTGKFKTDINFRIIQQAFDLFVTDPTDWKKMVAVM